MTNRTSALRPVTDPELAELRPLLAATAPALRLAESMPFSGARPHHDVPRAALRHPDLVADLRRARAARFSDGYEALSLRRRRAQIAARHALGE
jgi:hypothetical protein